MPHRLALQTRHAAPSRPLCPLGDLRDGYVASRRQRGVVSIACATVRSHGRLSMGPGGSGQEFVE